MLSKLLEIMPAPSASIEIVTNQQWEVYELITGIALPDDYKSYLSIYGTGLVGGIITPINPFCMRQFWAPHLTCKGWMELAFGIKNVKQMFGENTFPYPLYPEVDGVLPWGRSDNGDLLYWVTKASPDKWTTLINEARSSNFEEFEHSMTSFLYGWITGEIHSDMLPHDEIDQNLLFEPF